MDPDTPMQNQRDKPAHEVRIGTVKAAVWRNDTSNGVRYNATFTRLYRDKENHEWKFTDSFGRDDLLVLGKVADMVHTWICTQAQEQPGRTQARSESSG